MTQQAASTVASGQYVTLGIDHEIFAVGVEYVHEILDVQHITLVPNAPAYVLGMIDVRQRTVPVIDLRTRLGFPTAPTTQTARIVVLDVEAEGRTITIGLLADRVYEVSTLSEHEMEPPPDIGIRWRSDYIKGVGRRGESLVIVLDIGYLFSSEEAAQIETTLA